MEEKMLKIAQEITMKKTPEEAFGMVLKDFIDRKIVEYTNEMRRYEEKYGMSFEEFEKRINDKEFAKELEKERGVIQVENDYFDWSGAVTDLRYLNDKLEKLGK